MQKEIAEKIINKTISDYSKIAAHFDRARGFIWPIMQEFSGYVKSGDNVLDFGCGNGRLLDSIKAEEIVYKGIDPVSEFIDIVRQKYQDVTAFDQSARGRATKIKRSVEFKTMSFDVDNFRLDFPDKYFDHIFAIAVFHHLPSQKLREDVLREFARILKDDGSIYLTVWNLWRGEALRAHIRFILRKIFAKMDNREYDGVSISDLDLFDLFIPYTAADNKTTVQRYHHAFTKREIRKIAKNAGLKAEKVFYDDKKYNLCSIIKKSISSIANS